MVSSPAHCVRALLPQPTHLSIIRQPEAIVTQTAWHCDSDIDLIDDKIRRWLT